jgi:hypothetical protein
MGGRSDNKIKLFPIERNKLKNQELEFEDGIWFGEWKNLGVSISMYDLFQFVDGDKILNVLSFIFNIVYPTSTLILIASRPHSKTISISYL